MKSVLIGLQNTNGNHELGFECPACGFAHSFDPGLWVWNGDMVRPTFSPSLLVQWKGGRCHLFVRDGFIEFCADSSHSFAGRRIVMEPVDGGEQVNNSEGGENE